MLLKRAFLLHGMAITKTKNTFIEALTRQILVCDGAIGTELRKRTPSYLQCVDACNISTEHAEKVTAIHRAYVEAGADVIQTNTYQANREALGVHGLTDQVEDINKAGVMLARAAAPETCYIAGSVGQIPFQTLETNKVPSTKIIRRFFKEQMDALVDAGVDLLVLETFVSPKQAEIATKQALTYDIPVVVEISGVSGGTVGTGLDVRVFAQELEQLGVQAVGINCRGPHDLVEAMELLAPVIKVPIAVQPNAGNPRVEQGEVALSYTVEAEDFSDYVGKLIDLGANMIGGCCGTTPAYTAKIRQAVTGREPVKRQSRIFVLPKIQSTSKAPSDNPVQQVFETRERIVSVETPRQYIPTISGVVEGSQKSRSNRCRSI